MAAATSVAPANTSPRVRATRELRDETGSNGKDRIVLVHRRRIEDHLRKTYKTGRIADVESSAALTGRASAGSFFEYILLSDQLTIAFGKASASEKRAASRPS